MRWCPICDQGFVGKVKIKDVETPFYLCSECEAVWTKEEDMGTREVTNLSDHMKSMGRPIDLREVEVLDDGSG
jgi:Zn-finger nucleic acid-binding protein